MAIRVHKPGLFTTIQDLGRYGYSHLGISPAGVADPLSFRIGNLLVGNDVNAPALEMTLLGATLEFEETAVIAITGADCEPKLGSARVPLNTAVEVPAGAALTCGNMLTGARSYLAVQGGFDVPLVMGSASTDVRGRFGGSRTPFAKWRRTASAPHKAMPRSILAPKSLEAFASHGLIRITRGAQQDWFDASAFEMLFYGAYTVSDQSDRAGLRLKGEPLHPRESRQLLTDGIPLGAIQVPQDGQPIILFVLTSKPPAAIPRSPRHCR